MEVGKVCSVICYIAGTVFLVIALFGLWRHLLLWAYAMPLE